MSLFQKSISYTLVFQFTSYALLSGVSPATADVHANDLIGYSSQSFVRANPAVTREYFRTHPEHLNNLGGTERLEELLSKRDSYPISQNMDKEWIDSLVQRSFQNEKGPIFSWVYGMDQDVDIEATFRQTPALQQAFAKSFPMAPLGTQEARMFKARYTQDWVLTYGVENLQMITDAQIKTAVSSLSPEEGALVPYVSLRETVSDWQIERLWEQAKYEHQHLVLPTLKAALAPPPKMLFEDEAASANYRALQPLTTISSYATNISGYVLGSAEMILSGISTGMTTASEYTLAGFNRTLGALKYVGNAAYDSAQKANAVKKEFVTEGFDLYPLAKASFIQGMSTSKQAHADASDWWNQPAEDYPPVVMNIMQAFASEFGPKLHFILLNANNALGADVTSEIIQKLGLTQRVGTKVGDQFLRFTNPLGWAGTLLSMADMGLLLTDMVQDGLLGKLKAQVAKIAGKAMGIPQSLIDSHIRAEEVKLIFQKEDEKFQKFLTENDLNPKGEGWFSSITNYATVIRNYVRYAPDEYIQAKQTHLYANHGLNEAKNRFLDGHGPRTRDQVKGMAKLASFNMLRKGLEKTLDKTLHSLTLDLEDAVGQYTPVSTAPYAKATFKAFILGTAEDPSVQIKQAKQATSVLKEGANAVKTVARNPMTVIKAMSPKIISEAASAICSQTDRLVGKAVSYGTTTLTARKIRELGLERIQLFDDSQLKLNTDLRAMTSSLPETTQQAVGFLEEFVDVDHILKKTFDIVGKQAAQRMAYMVATIVQKKIVAAGQDKYTLEDLMGREIPMSVLDKAKERLTKWWGASSG